MAEHELCKLGVTGSNPVASTIRNAESGMRRLSKLCFRILDCVGV